MSSGLYSHTTRGIGTILTAAIYNADHNNHITNANPTQHGGYSDDTAQMQLTTDPGGVGSEVLASSLADEIRRIRFVIKRICGTTHWYEAPATSLGLVGGGLPLSLAFASTPLSLRRTENDTTAREILSLGSGSGVGNKFALQMVGTASNAAAELRLLHASTEIRRITSTLVTHFIAQEFRNYLDIKEISAPASPAADVLRLYAKDVSGSTKLFYKNSTGAEQSIGNTGAYGYAETNIYTTVNTDITLDDSVPLNTEGTQILSESMTFNRADSKVRVSTIVPVLCTSNTNVIIAIYRGSVCIAAKNMFAQGNIYSSIELECEDTPASVGPHTYSVRIGRNPASPNNIYINGNSSGRLLGGASRATLFIEEKSV